MIAFVLQSPPARVQKPYAVLSQDERQRFWKAAEHPRERALVSLALGAGLRVSDLVNVRLEDSSQDEDGGWWVRASGRNLRRKSDREMYLFSTRQSPRMTMARAWQIVKALVKGAGIEKPVSPHSLRHTMAIETLRAGAGPVVIQKLLGHAGLSATQCYVDHLERADLGQLIFGRPFASCVAGAPS